MAKYTDEQRRSWGDKVRVRGTNSPGNQFTPEQRKAWGAEQDRLRALRNAPGYQKPAPAKRASRAKTLVADTSDSECFDSLTYRNGTVEASFIGPAAGIWEYSLSRSEWNDWMSFGSLGLWFNLYLREPPAKGN